MHLMIPHLKDIGLHGLELCLLLIQNTHDLHGAQPSHLEQAVNLCRVFADFGAQQHEIEKSQQRTSNLDMLIRTLLASTDRSGEAPFRLQPILLNSGSIGLTKHAAPARGEPNQLYRCEKQALERISGQSETGSSQQDTMH